MDQIEFIVEISKGPLGRVWLARLASGSELGRVVAVRCVPVGVLKPERVASVLEAAELARRTRHPALAKVLGAGLAPDELRVVGEYVEGEYLSALRALLFRGGRPLSLGVCKRIIVGALRAAQGAHQALVQLGEEFDARVLFTDTILVANFGETLITDPCVASGLERALLVEAHGTGEPPRQAEQMDSDTIERSEVFQAALLLLELLVNRPLGAREQFEPALVELESRAGAGESDADAGSALAAVLGRGLASDPASRFSSLGEFARAIESFGAPIASEREVQVALSAVAGTRLEGRRYLLEGRSDGSNQSERRPSSRPTNRPVQVDSARFSSETPTSNGKLRTLGSARSDGPSAAPSPPRGTASAADPDSGTWLAQSASAPSKGPFEASAVSSMALGRRRGWGAKQLAGFAAIAALVLASLVWRVLSVPAAILPDRSSGHALHAAASVSAAPPPEPTATQIPAEPEPNPVAGPSRQHAATLPPSAPQRGVGSARAAQSSPPPGAPFHPHSISPYQPRGI